MRKIVLVLLMAGVSTIAAAECVTMEEAAKKVGDTLCVTAKVLKVAESRGGNFFLDFCTNYRECPFTVYVPAKNVRDVGDVRELEGKTIDIHGKVQSYGGRTEIVLTDARQLKGGAAKLPPAPKDFDVERKGNFSPGERPKKK